MFDYRELARKNSSKRKTVIKLTEDETLTLKDVASDRSVSARVRLALSVESATFSVKLDDATKETYSDLSSEAAAKMIETRFAFALESEKKREQETQQRAANKQK